jgi:predicted nucleic acid-binding protein
MDSVLLLDSSVIIDAINARNGRSEFLERLVTEGSVLACCSINITEVTMGMRPHEVKKTEDVLASLWFYPVTREVARLAGELYREWRKKGVTLALPDLTIAAIAIANDLRLATDNPKDFPMRELKLLDLP